MAQKYNGLGVELKWFQKKTSYWDLNKNEEIERGTDCKESGSIEKCCTNMY